MELSSKYNPIEVEDKWYAYWMENSFFHSEPDESKEPYTIVIPPPNVTGVLHMGHMLNNTIQDVLIRRARMLGKNALWVPGTDHASIATEAKVVKMLKEKGINKRDLTREEFLDYAWKWKEKYGGIILEQLKKLGASCDWDRTAFTMDPALSESVIKIFVDLYNKGHIYRGYRMVNWDPEGRTALADDEVIYKDVQSKLYYVNYQIEGEDEYLTIATTRPETILGDSAICINPKDERYKHLHGKNAIVPLVNRVVPIIQDSYVDMEFGTGCLKVTPAHDINDYELGQKYDLEVIDIMNEDGTMSKAAQLYIGEDRFTVRKKISKDLKESGNLIKSEDYANSVGYSERTDAVIEPRLSLQWYVRMEDLTKPALKNVMDNTVKLVPSKFKNMYKHWMDNVRDWCISRQLWWGQQIPAYYLMDENPGSENAQIFVAETAEEALQIAKEQTGRNDLTLDDLQQDDDVLDTWFSSGLWPITVFDGIRNPENEQINYYYPTNDLVTAPEILFFWVARMIMYGYEYREEKPFENVYLTGIVRDKQGRKMSKSLGNSPDPLELIAQYGADGVRTGMLFSSPAGNDLLFDIKLCEQGRNFANKVWNAFRLVTSWEIDDSLDGKENEIAINWMESRFNSALVDLDEQYSKFRISDALMTTYKLVWGDFCSWFLEMVKPEYQKPIDRNTYEKTKSLFENVLKILHPFMPFISEELWHHFSERSKEDCIITAAWPTVQKTDKRLIEEAELAFELISALRNVRNSKNLSKNQLLELYIKGDMDRYNTFSYYIQKLGNLEKFEILKEELDGISLVVHKDEFLIPLEQDLNPEEELLKLEKDLTYQEGFKATCEKKLSNERFVQNAPANVVDNEKRKLSDANEKIAALKVAINKLKKIS